MSLFAKRPKRHPPQALRLDLAAPDEEELAPELDRERRDQEGIRRGRHLGKNGGVFSVQAPSPSPSLFFPRGEESMAQARTRYMEGEGMEEEPLPPLPSFRVSTERDGGGGVPPAYELVDEGLGWREEGAREMQQVFRDRKLEKALEEMRQARRVLVGGDEVIAGGEDARISMDVRGREEEGEEELPGQDTEEFEDLESQIIRRALKSRSTLLVLDQTDRLKQLKHEHRREERIEQLQEGEVLAQVERELKRTDALLRDLHTQKLNLQRATAQAQEVLGGERERPPLDRVETLLEGWRNRADLLLSKQPMLAQAALAASREDQLYSEGVRRLHFGPPSDLAARLLPRLDLLGEITSLPPGAVEGLTGELEEALGRVSRLLCHGKEKVQALHLSERDAIFRGVGGIVADVDDPFLDIDFQAQETEEALQVCRGGKDEGLLLSASSYLAFLCRLHCFGYNPLGGQWAPVPSLASLEVVQTLTARQTPVAQSLLHAVLDRAVGPFLREWLDTHLDPLDLGATQVLAGELSLFLRLYYAPRKTDHTLAQVKQTLERVLSRFHQWVALSSPLSLGPGVLLLLRSLRYFEEVLPDGAISQTLLHILFTGFADPWFQEDRGLVQGLPILQTGLVLLTSFSVSTQPEFQEQLSSRLSLLPLSVRNSLSPS